jgi:hypothetical protein
MHALNSISVYILSLFASLTLSLTLPARRNACTGHPSDTGYCTILTYIDRTSTSPHPPKIAQCYDSCRGYLADAGDWSIDFVSKPENYTDVVSTEPCGFAVGRGEGERGDYQCTLPVTLCVK